MDPQNNEFGTFYEKGIGKLLSWVIGSLLSILIVLLIVAAIVKVGSWIL